MEDEHDDRCVDCQIHIRDALAKTLDTFRPTLSDKYRISEDHVRDAIGWAGINIAIENFLGKAYFSDDQRQEMQIHINYLLHGALLFAQESDEENQ